jgi:DNA-binding MarR family transcriptional regulator
VIDLKAVNAVMAAIDLLREATGNKELQAQTMLTFLHIAKRHPNEVAMGEIEDALGLSQTGNSRNVRYLAKGVTRSDGSEDVMGGYKLITIEEDPHYRKRKLCKLTAKGLDLAERISAAIASHNLPRMVA